MGFLLAPKPITTSLRIYRAACSALRFSRVRAAPRRDVRSVIRSKSRLRSSSLTRLNNERGCRRSTSFQPPSTSTPFSNFVERMREFSLPPPSLFLYLSVSLFLFHFNVGDDDYDDYVDEGERCVCGGGSRVKSHRAEALSRAGHVAGCGCFVVLVTRR